LFLNKQKNILVSLELKVVNRNLRLRGNVMTGRSASGSRSLNTNTFEIIKNDFWD